MRTEVLYFARLRGDKVAALLAIRDEVFPRELVPRHRIRWVATSTRGGYWTT